MIKKRGVAFILSLILLTLSVVIPSAAQSELPAEEDLRQQNQEISIQTYQHLTEYLSEHIRQTDVRMDDASRTLAGMDAGAYIDEPGNLVANITDTSAPVREELQTATEDPQIQYRLVQHNLQMLNEIYMVLSSYLGEAPYFEVVLSETNNTVEVYTDQNPDLCMEYIANIADVSAVTVIQENNTFEDCATVCAGDTAVCIETAQRGTVGFPCTQNSTGKKGIVTAAHVVSSSLGTLGNTVQVNGKNFGTVNATRWGNNVDAAFILKKQSLWPLWWTFKSALPNGDKIHSWSDPSITPEGTVVKKYGSTTGLSSGKIISNSASFEVNGSIFYALTKTSMYSDHGDSGGPCIVTNQGKNILLGIVKGRDANLNTYFCKINYIMKELNVTPIVG